MISQNYTKTFLWGLVIGGLATALTTPWRGREARQAAKQKWYDLSDRKDAILEQGAEKAQRAKTALEDATSEIIADDPKKKSDFKNSLP